MFFIIPDSFLLYNYELIWKLVKNPEPKTLTGRTQTYANRDGQGKLP